ncbi:MAG TPA: YqgE/AlgH family protein [Acidimicrobiia bacterium]|nr:YqgE/AlgH family protein [Acidimicrobiia bacterium]
MTAVGESLRGRLLVATPPLVDPNFDRTVVLVLEHGDDGALGIVLNRPSATALGEILPEWSPLASGPRVVFTGGPVMPEAVIALGRVGPPGGAEGFVSLLHDLVTLDLDRDPLDLGAPLDSLRVFVGYAGWGPGQLENELAQHAWFVVDVEPDDVFADHPEQLWRTVLRRQRGHVALFANYPEDATVN